MRSITNKGEIIFMIQVVADRYYIISAHRMRCSVVCYCVTVFPNGNDYFAVIRSND